MNLIKSLLLITLLLVACSPMAATPPDSSVQAIEIVELPTSITEPKLIPTTLPTITPTEEPIYPYYLPLATKLEDASQTIGKVTLKIDWVYVDEARVAITYTISGLDWPDGSMMDGMQQVRMSIPALSNFRFGGFSGGSGVGESMAASGVITARSDQLLLDGALDAEKYPNINVKIEIPVEGPTKVGTFHFSVTVPVLNGIRIENIDQTVVANNVSMTLKSLIVNPSRVEALICFQMPSSADWGLNTSVLTINGRDYLTSGGGLAQGPDGRLVGDLYTNRCNDVGFDIAYGESVESVTLTVPRLQASVNEVVTEEVVERANQQLADKDIQFDYENVDHGGNIVIIKRPEGATDAEIYPLIWDALVDQYEGPWAFTVQMPK